MVKLSVTVTTPLILLAWLWSDVNGFQNTMPSVMDLLPVGANVTAEKTVWGRLEAMTAQTAETRTTASPPKQVADQALPVGEDLSEFSPDLDELVTDVTSAESHQPATYDIGAGWSPEITETGYSVELPNTTSTDDVATTTEAARDEVDENVTTSGDATATHIGKLYLLFVADDQRRGNDVNDCFIDRVGSYRPFIFS